MKTKLANYLNAQASILKENQYLERMTGVPANYGIVGRQYGRPSEANRAIRKFKVRHFALLPSDYKFWVNRLDEGCVEVCGYRY